MRVAPGQETRTPPSRPGEHTGTDLPRDPLLGTVLAERYQIESLLGRGGMGRVYRAWDRVLGVSVALKVFRSELVEQEEQLRRIYREIRTGRAINHPQVVRIHDMGRDGVRLFLTMDLVEGTDLGRQLAQGPLPVEQAIPLALDILSGLEAAHQEGIIHRDLKPRNIMIDQDGRGILTDFGLAKSLKGDNLTRTHELMGTPQYIPPEQWMGMEQDSRSDIYAFGIILYEMLYGQLPFQAESDFGYLQQHLNHPVILPPASQDKTPSYLREIIRRCLAKSPRDRYGDVGLLRRDLLRNRVSLGTQVRTRIKDPRLLRLRWLLPLLLIPGLILWRILAPPAPQTHGMVDLKPSSLAVLRFLSPQKDSDLQRWGSGITDLLTADLGQSELLSVIPDSQIYRFLIRENLLDLHTYPADFLERFTQAHPVDFLVTGTLQRFGSEVRLSLKLISGRDQRLVYSDQKSVQISEGYFGLVDDLSWRIKTALKMSPSQLATDPDRPISEITTTSQVAMDAFQKGKEAFYRRQYDQAVEHLLESVQDDSNFSRSHYLLSQAASYAGRFDLSHQQALLALKTANQSTPRDAFLINAWKARHVDNNLGEAARILSHMNERYPRDEEGRIMLAALYRDLGDMERAKTLLGPPPFQTPQLRQQALHNLLYIAHLQGDQDRFLHLYQELSRQYHSSFASHLAFFWYLRQGSAAMALDILDHWDGRPAEKDRRNALLLLSLNRPQEAWEALKPAEGEDWERADKARTGALIFLASGQTGEAQKLLESLSPLGDVTGETNPERIRTLFDNNFTLSRICDAAGQSARARSLLEHCLAIPLQNLSLRDWLKIRFWLLSTDSPRIPEIRQELENLSPERLGWGASLATAVLRTYQSPESQRAAEWLRLLETLPLETSESDFHAFFITQSLRSLPPQPAPDALLNILERFEGARLSSLFWGDVHLELLREGTLTALKLNRRELAQTLGTRYLNLTRTSPALAPERKRLSEALALNGLGVGGGSPQEKRSLAGHTTP